MNRETIRLDRHLRLHGEPVQLCRMVAGVQRHRLPLRATVKTLGIEQLIGGITTTNYFVVISPTQLRRKAYPGALPATIPSGVAPLRDDMIPRAGQDTIIVRGEQKAIVQVDAIYDKGEVVRIEIKVGG